MIFRFNDEMLRTIEKVSNQVADILGVENATLCVSSGPNELSDHDFSLCFETEENDTYAVWEFKECRLDLQNLLNDFLINSRVEWRKEGNRYCKPEMTLTLGERMECNLVNDYVF